MATSTGRFTASSITQGTFGVNQTWGALASARIVNSSWGWSDLTAAFSLSSSLDYYNFGLSIPAGQRMTGVKAYVQGYQDVADRVKLFNISVYDSTTGKNVQYTPSSSYFLPTTDSETAFGSDVISGGEWDYGGTYPMTTAAMNSSNFMISLMFIDTGSGGSFIWIDGAEFEVWYEPIPSASGAFIPFLV